MFHSAEKTALVERIVSRVLVVASNNPVKRIEKVVVQSIEPMVLGISLIKVI